MADEEVIQEEQKEVKCKCVAGAPAWMVTYSDLVTLLLTFFVLLISMASMDPVKFTEASSSIKDAFGIHSSPLSVEFAIPIFPSPPIADFSPIHQQPTKKVYEKIKTQIDSLRLNDEVGVLQNEDGSIILRINDSILFKQGQTRIPSKSYSILRTLADIIRPLPMNLRIEGHTDDTPITDNSFGNWDLSVARAVSVLRFFSKSDLLALDRMAATGYGKERPVVQNIDEITRALNRRVDFVLTLNESSITQNGTPQSNNVPL